MVLLKMMNFNMLFKETVLNLKCKSGFHGRSIESGLRVLRISGIFPNRDKVDAMTVNIRKRVLKLAKAKAENKIRKIANFFL